MTVEKRTHRMLGSLKIWAKELKRNVITLMVSSRDPVTPLLPKVLAIITVAYALSPIDLIPDFIPVIGYVDDLIIVPAGIWLCLRLIPKWVIANNRAKAEAWLASNPVKPHSIVGLVVVLVTWLCSGWFLWRWLASGA